MKKEEAFPQNYYCSKECMGLVGKENCQKICPKCGKPVAFHMHLTTEDEIKEDLVNSIGDISKLLTLQRKLNDSYELASCPNCGSSVSLKYGIFTNGFNINKLPTIYLEIVCSCCNREWVNSHEDGTPMEVKEAIDGWNDTMCKKKSRKYHRLADMVLNK